LHKLCEYYCKKSYINRVDEYAFHIINTEDDCTILYIYNESAKICYKRREKYRCLVAGYESCACLKSKQTDKDIVYVQYTYPCLVSLFRPLEQAWYWPLYHGAIFCPVELSNLYFHCHPHSLHVTYTLS